MNGPPEEFGSAYRLLSAAVVPRPIAWVSTQSSEGVANLAPFSFFNVVSIDPPVLMVAPVGTGDDLKDTARNALETEELVVQVVTEDLAAAMNATSATLEPGEDEFEHAGVDPAESVAVDVPRVAAAEVAFECSLYEATAVGSSTMLLAEVEHAHVADDLLADGKLDVTRLDAVGRLAGGYYERTDDRFHLERPP